MTRRSPLRLGLAVLAVLAAQGLAAQPQPRAGSEIVKSAASSAAATARYREARALERKGDPQGALLAYEDAAQAGHGRAQMRLAEIYDKGNTAVKRDYAKALYWYERARAQGLQIPKPHPYVSGR